MKIKKFYGKTTSEALQAVKEAFGEEAVILTTRRIRRDGKYLYEVSAAMDFEPQGPAPSERNNSVPQLEGVQAELASLKGLVERLATHLLGPEVEDASLKELLYRLGASPRVISELSASYGLDGGGRPPAVWLKLELSRRLSHLQPAERFPRYSAFVGPSGAGKTTTVAKLAARFARRAGRRGLLVSLDDYRLGAHEQLARFARLAEVDFVAARPEALGEILRENADKDFVMIDTPGFSLEDERYPDLLHGIFQGDLPVRAHLVLPATAGAGFYSRLWRFYQDLPLCGLIFTKTDEAETFGVLLEPLLFWNQPVNFITTGQRIPEDIQVASGRRLLALVCRHLDELALEVGNHESADRILATYETAH
ncbi:hypothetical protein G4V39_10375 [Thermosulfuriphilus ammonigenes]|uniref:Uncharacterized protein n=1 Tax=Thermosulfuriphilus ammonigenes TaxID=1936021 RepID=A0A6G7PY82_9BACT|nr:hypothetical protein [Thermosulfuriphilus ammonigenes]MBA2849797.1 flagellar biosynthesis protein FlhF [Thermosulfuriphilus ammonigenes]QIJ72655.1 hypothetical protein G4V39_10375 [Thermosulfuriphilus ammonigenes]